VDRGVVELVMPVATPGRPETGRPGVYTVRRPNGRGDARMRW
jgi:hypothetical protein